VVRINKCSNFSFQPTVDMSQLVPYSLKAVIKNKKAGESFNIRNLSESRFFVQNRRIFTKISAAICVISSGRLPASIIF